MLIEHVDTIVEIRRNAVLEESRFPKELNTAFRNMENAGNPWGQPRSARLDWAKGLRSPSSARRTRRDPRRTGDGAPWRTIFASQPMADALAGRVLLWVGCAGAFDDRNRKVVRAMAQLLPQAEVPFSVLGSKETCTGDPARRAGNEYLYQMLAEENVATLGRARRPRHLDDRRDRPHCFNTIRNEYPQLGCGLQVIHHTQLLDRLVAEGRLVRPSTTRRRRLPRRLLSRPLQPGLRRGPRVVESVPGQSIVEMDLHHRRGMCCGAGGARMWMEEREGTRINHKRVEQALEKSPDEIATSCPFCLIMLRDGTTDLQRTDVAVRDVAELLADATGAWTRDVGAGPTLGRWRPCQ